MLRSLKSFLQDRAGNVLIMFAGVGDGMTLMVGAGVDYTGAYDYNDGQCNFSCSGGMTTGVILAD